MTPIHTGLNTLAILRECLYCPFDKEPVGLKHEKKKVIQFHFPFSVSSKGIKMKAITIKKHKYKSKQISQGTQNPPHRLTEN